MVQVADPAEGIAAKIRELEDLRQQGLVSEEEFETKRRELLDRM
ncbi:MAG: SHOCT domain-containing protein [Actinobacteria bacterium]|nr:SHOCT domain-containing protein [Actinomycetota bacterium]